MEAVKVSVILPVYNVEKYLDQCLDSVVNQTLREIEIICINDGSTDRSQEILRRYQAQDPRIQAYLQSNSGLGAARNAGMEHAVGEYLIFWDSDDFFDLTALEKLYAKAKVGDADICVCGQNRLLTKNGNSIQYEIQPIIKYLPSTMPFNLAAVPEYILNFAGSVVWNKLFRREFLQKNQLSFLPVRRAEDVYFTSLALCLAERITVLNEALITYRVFREDSLTSTQHENLDEVIDVWLKTADALKEREAYPERSFLNRALGGIFFLFRTARFSWLAFEKAFYRLKNGDLQKLGLVLREPGYYIVPWQEELLAHLYREDAEGFLMSYLTIMDMRLQEQTAKKSNQTKKSKQKLEKLTARNAQLEEQARLQAQRDQETIQRLERKIEKLNRQNDRLKRSLGSIKASFSFKIGRAVTWLPRKIKRALKK